VVTHPPPDNIFSEKTKILVLLENHFFCQRKYLSDIIYSKHFDKFMKILLKNLINYGTTWTVSG
jgi:hypothetical protein